MVNDINSSSKRLKNLLRKFYKVIDDKNLRQRNLVDARDAFDRAYSQIIILTNYVNNQQSLLKPNKTKLLKDIKTIVDDFKMVNIPSTIKDNYELTKEENEIKSGISKNAINIINTINTIHKLIE